jgi:hypothetical protein
LELTSDAEKQVYETAYWEPKESYLRQTFCASYSSMDVSEKRMVWYTFSKRSNIEIIEAGRLLLNRNWYWT